MILEDNNDLKCVYFWSTYALLILELLRIPRGNNKQRRLIIVCCYSMSHFLMNIQCPTWLPFTAVNPVLV